MKLQSVTILLLFSLALAAPVPAGWQKQQQNQQVILQPANLQAGELYSITVFPAFSLQGKDLQDWMQTFVAEDAAKRGKVTQKVQVSNQKGILVGSGMVQNQSKTENLMYFGVQSDSGWGQVMLVQTGNDAEVAGKYSSATSEVLSGLIEELNARTPPSEQKAQQTPQEETSKNEPEEKPFQWTTRPGKGLQTSEIKGLYLTYVPEFNGLSLLYEYKEHLALLLKDGTAYLGLQVPPEDLDLKASRKNEPEQWTKWKTTGQKLLFLDQKTQKWQELKSKLVVPARKGEKIQGDFEAIQNNASAFYGGSIREEHYLFSAKGTFEIARNAEFASSSGSTVSGYSQSNKEGSSGGVSTGSGVSTSSSSQKTNPDLYGTYTLNGYTLELHLKSGAVQRKLFFFTSSKKDEIFIEKATYFPSSNE
ncbi:hypothetical protein [Deinococcus roseus]|uniref:Uncharacterized protein n=1 Tax=Deinococcus roseus TaxID=392414 RepID=A0ABQ2CT91_9DEIO|nr:hypothetical protein [Deinococcus roseus]GGJ18972.1 hypothetical protein GCM10008938_01230 [Deinococcus roseus]